MSQKLFVRISETLNDFGYLIPREKYDSTIVDGFESETDQYHSVYFYNEEHEKHFKQKGTVRGITDVITDKLVFDFDNEDNVEQARLDTIEAVSRIKNLGVKPEDIELYFSGLKGFSVIVKLDRFISPEEHSHVALNVIGKGLETIDPSVYNPSRLFRVPNTKHPVSKLYKVKLSHFQLEKLSVDKIKALATSTKPVTLSKPVSLKPDLFALPKKIVEKEKKTYQMDNTSAPRHWKDYKWKLLNAVEVKAGERHNAMMVIGATCRGLGYNRDITESFLKTFDGKYAQATKQDERPEEVERTLDQIFSDNWNGGQFSVEKNAWLRKYCERVGIEPEREELKVIQLHDIEDEFIDYVKNIDKNTILTGIQEIDEAVPLTIGMNLGLIGAPSSGKTALALKILKNTSDAGVISVFASLDMRRNRLFEKLLYRVSGLSRKELYKAIQTDQSSEIFKKVKEEYKNVYFYDRSCPTVEDIRRYIKQVEDHSGQSVKLVMLDYFERVNADKSDDTAASKEVAGKLQDLVNDLNVCLITLVQPNKFSLSGGPDSPILSYTSIKGSSFIYQAFRSIISLWRPFFNPEWKDNDRFLEMAVLKNDLGEVGTFQFGWDGRRGEIWSITDEEKEELNSLLRQKNASKEKDSGNGWD